MRHFATWLSQLSRRGTRAVQIVLHDPGRRLSDYLPAMADAGAHRLRHRALLVTTSRDDRDIAREFCRDTVVYNPSRGAPPDTGTLPFILVTDAHRLTPRAWDNMQRAVDRATAGGCCYIIIAGDATAPGDFSELYCRALETSVHESGFHTYDATWPPPLPSEWEYSSRYRRYRPVADTYSDVTPVTVPPKILHPSRPTPASNTAAAVSAA